jgi:SAM-dependent methyltransferase
MADHVKPRHLSTGAHTEIWDELWQQKTTPWDRFEPHPALIDALNEKTSIVGLSTKFGNESPRKKALIPGCGRGYDVLLFASHGYDAYGLDISQTAVDACEELDKEQGDNTMIYPLRDAIIGRGSRHFFAADFFKDDLSSHTGSGRFDVIYDHTFLCALSPETRPQWSKRMSELLAPDGSSICLEFPLAKPPKAGGPPHGLSSELYVQLFKEPGKDVKYAEDGQVAPDDRSLDHVSGLVRVGHWSPERQHPSGDGTDMISVWKHAGSD